MKEFKDARRIKVILAKIKPLAAEYYRLTGKPLGVTGEIAEYIAAEKLGLRLTPARTEGHDALRGSERFRSKAVPMARTRSRGSVFPASS